MFAELNLLIGNLAGTKILYCSKIRIKGRIGTLAGE